MNIFLKTRKYLATAIMHYVLDIFLCRTLHFFFADLISSFKYTSGSAADKITNYFE